MVKKKETPVASPYATWTRPKDWKPLPSPKDIKKTMAKPKSNKDKLKIKLLQQKEWEKKKKMIKTAKKKSKQTYT